MKKTLTLILLLILAPLWSKTIQQFDNLGFTTQWGCGNCSFEVIDDQMNIVAINPSQIERVIPELSIIGREFIITLQKFPNTGQPPLRFKLKIPSEIYPLILDTENYPEDKPRYTKHTANDFHQLYEGDSLLTKNIENISITKRKDCLLPDEDHGFEYYRCNTKIEIYNFTLILNQNEAFSVSANSKMTLPEKCQKIVDCISPSSMTNR